MDYRRVIAVALLALPLAGCFEAHKGATVSLRPVCAALIGPMKHNPTNPKSDWHAGKKLDVEILRRNRVGVNLHCPKYR